MLQSKQPPVAAIPFLPVELNLTTKFELTFTFKIDQDVIKQTFSHTKKIFMEREHFLPYYKGYNHY